MVENRPGLTFFAHAVLIFILPPSWDELRQRLQQEYADEAIAAGLADAVDVQARSGNSHTFDLSGYGKVPSVLREDGQQAGLRQAAVDPESQRRVAVMKKRLALVQRDERSR